MSPTKLPPVALSDWDLTLCASFTIEPWIELLASRGLFVTQKADSVKTLFRQFENHMIDYEAFCGKIGLMYAAGLAGKSKQAIYDAAEDFVVKDASRIYEFTYEAISLLNRLSVPTLVVSGAPVEALTAYSKKLGFRVIGALEAAVAPDGFYTGELSINHGLQAEKEKVVKKVSSTNRVLIAFGDSVSDMPLLRAAEVGILVVSSDSGLPKIGGERIISFSPDELNSTLADIIAHLHVGG